jgi:hypothetical protein
MGWAYGLDAGDTGDPPNFGEETPTKQPVR